MRLLPARFVAKKLEPNNVAVLVYSFQRIIQLKRFDLFSELNLFKEDHPRKLKWSCLYRFMGYGRTSISNGPATSQIEIAKQCQLTKVTINK